MRAVFLRLAFAAIIGASCCACPRVLQPPIDPARYPVSAPDLVIQYRISDTFSYSQRAVVLEAMQMWSAGSGGRVAWQESDDDGLYVGTVPTMLDLPGVSQPNKRYVGITLREKNQIFVVVDWYTQRDQLLAIMCHELGHFLGLEHVSDRSDITLTCMTTAAWPQCVFKGEIPILDRWQFCRRHTCESH